VKKSGAGNSQVEAARKEIRANIRRELNTQKLRAKIDNGLSETMDCLLKEESHPINKLFALGRLDQANTDHWRVLAFLMADEIFGTKPRGAPLKGNAPIKNLELLVYLNEIHRIRLEDGYPSGVAEAILDLPAFFKMLAANPDTEKFSQRYQTTQTSSLKDYAHNALTEGTKLLQSQPDALSPKMTKIVEEALDNFRPGWRRRKHSPK